MTDTSNWRETVHLMKIHNKSPWTGLEEDYHIERIMVPLNPYQMGNLIDAVAQVKNNGDWYGEFCDIVARAMQVAGIKELNSNRGNKYTYEDILNREILRKK